MARTYEIPQAGDGLIEDLISGAAILVRSIIPEESEDALLAVELVTCQSHNRVIYPEQIKAEGWTIQLMGQMNEYAYRYARIKKGGDT